MSEHDNVNHPSHYNQYRGLEIIDLAEQMNFNRGNAVKYIARAGFKGGPEREIEDLEKARWYIDREIARVKVNFLHQGLLKSTAKNRVFIDNCPSCRMPWQNADQFHLEYDPTLDRVICACGAQFSAREVEKQ